MEQNKRELFVGQLSLFGDDAFVTNEETEASTESCHVSEMKSSSTIAADNKARTRSKKAVAKKEEEVPKKPPMPKLESINLGEGWKIHYAATQFEVDILFADELNTGVLTATLEEIRLKLVTEEDAAELTPSGTKWRYDIDQKKLYPEAWGQDKGMY